MSFLQLRKKPNQDQQAFIDDFSHNILLFAPAGSGKTFSIAKKIEKALSLEQFKPDELLCLTYTERARDEMQSDIEYYDTHNFQNVYTIHGFCLRTLREEAKTSGTYFADMRVIDQEDTEDLIRTELLPSFSRKVSNYYLFSRSGKSLDQYQKEQIVYVGEDNIIWKDGEFYVDMLGKYCTKERIEFLLSKRVCPCCGKPSKNLICEECGNDTRNYFPIAPQIKFEFYEFMTVVRHARELYGFVSDNLESDFQKTILKLKEEPKRYFSCTKQKFQSECKFTELMDLFGGWLISSFLYLCREKHAIDFDGMIIDTLHLFKGNCRFLSNHSYKMILVDEMQDTSELEFKVLSYLFPNAQIIFCGDYFQTIYEWRGSKPEQIITLLKRDYDVKEYYFRENYRSTVLLSQAANSYLKNAFPANSFLSDSTVHSKNEGEKIHCHEFETEAMQATWIYEKVNSLKDESTCLMCRSNYMANELKRRLNTIPNDELFFFSQDEQKKFYLNPVVKDFLAFLSLLIQPFDEISMGRISERYIRGIGKRRISQIFEHKEFRLCDFLSQNTYKNGDFFTFYNGNDFVVYDLETTGLDVTKDELIQIAAIRFDRFGNELSRLNRLVVPNIPISDGALKTHKKSLEELKQNGTTDIKSVLQEFLDFAEGSYLFGHNSTAFDRMILLRQLREQGLPYPNVIEEGDTLILSQRLLPKLPDHKLETLCRVFSIVNENAHDAFSDVLATKEVFLHLAQCLPPKEEREAFYRSYIPYFQKFYTKYTQLQSIVLHSNGKELLNELYAILSTRNDKTFLERWGTITTLFPSMECMPIAIKSYLEESKNTDKLLERLSETKNVIPIVTVHQTKGCEYDNVFLFGADDEHFPSALALRSMQEQEERRLFYVAMTRAKKRLFLTFTRYSNRDYSVRNDPSRYISFIDPEHIEFAQE